MSCEMDPALLWQWTNYSWAVGTTRHLLCLMRQPVYIPSVFSTFGDTSLFHHSIPTAGVNTPACIFIGFIPLKFHSLRFFFPLWQKSKQRGETLPQEIIKQWPKRFLFCTLLQADSALCWIIEYTEQLFTRQHISSSRSLSLSHLIKYRSSCADIETEIKNTQAHLKCL